MAITLTELNAFNMVSAWEDNTKLTMNETGSVRQAGQYGGVLSTRNRDQRERDANNAVRTALLKALARTFD